jgi:MoaA/NifB/PqqE/SkfB family radical SAM enzyme
LSHLVTARCNARCATCLWRDSTTRDVDTETIAWLYREAGRAGFVHLVVWGGEPLLRDDLGALLEVAKRSRLHVTLITNGWLLAERWPDLRGLVDTLILSVDAVGDQHDEMRGLPGLYGRMEEFALSLRADCSAPALLINTVLSRQNEDVLPRVAELARAWGAGLFFCPMETGMTFSDGRAESKAGLALDHEGLKAAAAQARRLKDQGYPILSTRAYLDLLESDPALNRYRCRVPHSLMTVEADGALRDCRRHDQPLADIRDLRAAGERLSAVFDLPRRRELLRESGSCTVCNNPDVIELSWLWDLRPSMLGKLAQLATR